MRALITGASSGIGKEFAKQLAQAGYELTLVARRGDRLRLLASELPTVCHIIEADLSDEQECRLLYEAAHGEDLQIVINNAGFGLFGEFIEADLDTELQMINVNIRAVHILTKLFLRDFVQRNQGCIINVASSAGFLPGPLMSVYYATKSYVLRLTQAIREELRGKGSAVRILALCPGPVDTEFNTVAKVRFSLPTTPVQRVVQAGIRGMKQNRGIVIPGFCMKFLIASSRLLPNAVLPRVTYSMQRKKQP